ncbi:ubiquitin carboxyl-terminal hydrolase 2-like isoform X1 [Olea europaea var. sylvestris]|uniref:ubiquitin carboxyl-terminal hydrolase 2-like isoform X1 n=1 Tax=Olea europaea var. sylvestris TaxID=158386 RepID=UPI000C1D20C6|nr:ubiquitin carboxyl-terminal hydrolase 2-like isoform X1 [Olea europaea var. sylvestris]XP_022871467.1 ubiquitin carboxyl-terminal hydrolase 2-like isoform X1 [Olea europaea var. sylvestris]
MRKKVKKKASSGQKEKKGSSASPKPISQQSIDNVKISENGTAVVNDRKVCSHITKGINLEKISSKLESLEPIACEDCRVSVADRWAGRGKAKHGKKGERGSKAESKAIWVCLECGFFSCGGVGFPTTPQSHAVRHAKQQHHPLAAQYENPQLQWCFPCNTLIPAEKSGEHNDVLHEIAKMLKEPPSERSKADVEDVWFGTGSVTSGIKEHTLSIGSCGSGNYSVRGIVNLGNTCFFNSTIQNLLAINKLRDYFFKLDESVGPLIAALRKLCLETSPEAGTGSVINPRSLFGSFCSKAPQFRGFQQHDSHEFLRCLLDGLYTEELSAKKHINSSQDDGKSTITDLTSVHALFGGQLSSTVSCLECAHSSKVYEQFLDLSLPVPTKKPPSKKVQTVCRGKKPKLPPKRSRKICSEVSKDTFILPARSVAGQLSGDNSSDELQSTSLPAEQLAASDSTSTNDIANDMGLSLWDISAMERADYQQATENVGGKSSSSDSFTWLDYLEPNAASNIIDMALEIDDHSGKQDSANENAHQNNGMFLNALESSTDCNLQHLNSTPSSDNVTLLDSLGQGISASESNLLAQSDEKCLPKCSVIKEAFQDGTDLERSSESSNQVFRKDSNPDISSSRDEELPLQIQDSEVLLLPYKEDYPSIEEVSKREIEVSSTLCNEQDSLDFDGFGDLFNEPESVADSNITVCEASEVIKSGFGVGNSSDSDPDEVDTTDAPVSVESCLAYFTKPELLSKDEHGWQCDNCSKVLQEQRIRLRKLRKARSEIAVDGLNYRNASDPLTDSGNCAEVKHVNGNEVIDNRNSTVKNYPQAEMYPIDPQLEDRKSESVSVCPGPAKVSTSSYQNGVYFIENEVSGESSIDTTLSGETDKFAEQSESEVRREGNVDSEKLKVKRDATKRILIDKAPSILTIHLKRFSQDARGRLSKLNGHVNFKEKIDLKRYMDPSCAERGVYEYRLIGVVEHLGTLRGGHYVAYVRGGAKSENGDCMWYHANDAHVHAVSLEEVLRCEAYILFYEQT